MCRHSARARRHVVKVEQDRRPIAVDIRLDALSGTEWRVCDRRVAESDHLSILGFIELRNGHFEVTAMSSPGDRVIFDSMGEARQSFASQDATLIHREQTVV
ncbi:hypothetical protein GCM10027029_05190 [Conyzicola lurida]